MSYVGYGQSPYVQEPKVRFEAIGEAWGMVREKMGVWVLATLLYSFGIGIIQVVLQLILSAAGLLPPILDRNPSFQTPYLFGYLISNITSIILTALMQGGFLRMAIKQTRGEDIQISDLFGAGDRIGAIIVGQLLLSIASGLGALLCVIPGFIVAGRGMLTLPIAVDQNVGGNEAFSKSWDALKNDTLNAVLFVIVAGLVSLLGALACGIGVLFTAPIGPLAIAIVYRDFFNTERQMAEPRLNVPLPPQSAYGPGRLGDVPPQGPPPPPGEMPRL